SRHRREGAGTLLRDRGRGRGASGVGPGAPGSRRASGHRAAVMKPRESPSLVGQEAAETALEAAAAAGRLAHAWLLAGPRGVGKATLAFRFARFLLADDRGSAGGLFRQGSTSGLHLDAGHAVF